MIVESIGLYGAEGDKPEEQIQNKSHGIKLLGVRRDCQRN